MKKIQLLLATISLVVLLVAIGCNNDLQNANNSDAPTKNSGSDEHVHADGGSRKDHSVEGHGHEPGPHGGTIVDWGGGKFHVEFIVDHEKKEATAYIFGTDEKTPKPIDSAEISLTIKEPSFTTTLKPSPQDGDPEGKASRFLGTHKGFATVREYQGSLSAVVDETPFSGKFDEGDHDH